jgi:hypothetical protein
MRKHIPQSRLNISMKRVIQATMFYLSTLAFIVITGFWVTTRSTDALTLTAYSLGFFASMAISFRYYTLLINKEDDYL